MRCGDKVSKKKPSVDRILNVSTSHITTHDHNLLLTKNEDDACKVAACFSSYPYDEGWFLYLYDNPSSGFHAKDMTAAGFSHAFCDIVKFAVENKCSLIRLDADAEQYEDFPTFNW